jgi:hypothetical protein
MAFASLDDLKSFLRLAEDGNDSALAGFLVLADEIVAEICGPSVPVSVTETVTGLPLVTRRIPVASLVSIIPSIGAAADLASVTVDARSGIVLGYPPPYSYRAASYTVTYLCGWVTVPQRLKMACLEIAAHSWVTSQRGPMGSKMPGYDETEIVIVGSGYAVPNRAKEYMQFDMGPKVR